MINRDMISLDDFKYSSFEKKCDVVTTKSDYLMMRKLGNCKIYLYYAGEFFIEVYYSPTYKKVLMINAFNDAAGLQPYAESISLEDLNLKSSI
ncbi:MAG TPA: hypothetical protein VIT44_17790 [Cyclobacteriaceae bacterium]